jgi:MFS family permease
VKKWLLVLAALVLVTGAHFALFSLEYYREVGRFGEPGAGVYLQAYLNEHEQGRGAALGLICAFAVYLAGTWFQTRNRKSVTAGAATALVVFLAPVLLLGAGETPMFEYMVKKVGWIYVELQDLVFMVFALLAFIAGVIAVRVAGRNTVTKNP